ncbi:MAG TPA: hypothetical protein VMN77_12285 [Nitrospiria bacterium]|jgi:hypothetical protein|nr:hypothetical protein [Nitrospiria bacterium]
MKVTQVIAAVFFLEIALTACTTRPIRVPDAMPAAAAVEAPDVVRAAEKLDADLVDQSWHPATIKWPQLNRGLFDWTATVKNDAPQSRDICVVFHLFNASHQALRGVRGCRVVAPGHEGHIALNAYIDLDRLKQARSGHVDPYESHTIYFPGSATN